MTKQKCDECGKELKGLSCTAKGSFTCSICNTKDAIHCETGCIVKMQEYDAGDNEDVKIAKKYLKMGQEYEVLKVEVDSWVSYIQLKEFQDIWFNSAHFKRVQ